MRSTIAALLFVFCLVNPSKGSNFGLEINGACISGNCPSTVQPIGGSETDTINDVLTLADGDIFQVFGTFNGANPFAGGFSTGHDFQVTYEGNAAGVSSGNDTINVVLLYDFASGGSGSVTFDRDVIGAFGPGIAPTSSASSCVDGTLGCTGTLTPPGAFSSTSSFPLSSSAGVYTFTPDFISDFDAGSAVGSYVVWGQTSELATPPVTTPEPGSIATTDIGIMSLAAFEYIRRRKALPSK